MDNNKEKVIKSIMYEIRLQLGATLKKTLIPYLIESLFHVGKWLFVNQIKFTKWLKLLYHL
jgi:hypothetical protein